MTVQDEIRQRIEKDVLLARLRRKIDSGKADFNDTFLYSDRAGKLLGEIFSRRLPDIPLEEREALCVELLRDRYTDINQLIDRVQRALDEAQNLHIAPQHAPFRNERAHKIGNATADPTVPVETQQRRAESAPATMTRAMHDDRMKKEADFRSRAGLQCYITRKTDGKCCEWCDKMAGRYEYHSEPKDIYRRHDNCGCSVTYENGRQRQDVWSKRTWEAPEPGAGAGDPVVFTAEQAKALQKEKQLKVLTSEQENGKIENDRKIRSSPEYAVPKSLTNSREFREKFDKMTDDKELQREFYQASKEMLRHRSGTNGEDLYFYNTRTKKWTKSVSGTTASSPEYTPEIKTAIAESNDGEIIAFHNHPAGMPPSDGDINAAFDNGYLRGYTIGHNGRIFEYTKPEIKIQSEVYKGRVARYLNKSDENDRQKVFEAQLRAITELQELYGFTIREVL